MIPCGLKESGEAVQQWGWLSRDVLFIIDQKASLLAEKLQQDADKPYPGNSRVSIERRGSVLDALHQVRELAFRPDWIAFGECRQVAFQREDRRVAGSTPGGFIMQHDGAAVTRAEPGNLCEPRIADVCHVMHGRFDRRLGVLERRH